MDRVHVGKDRYLANLSIKLVHDLLNEKTDCLIDSFIGNGLDINFDCLEAAKLTGYTFCEHCLCEE